MAAERFPKYFVVIMSIYAAVFLFTAYALSPALADAASLVFLMLIPAILFGIYALKYPARWLRVAALAAAIILSGFSIIFVLPAVSF